jgi:hypothetical protein
LFHALFALSALASPTTSQTGLETYDDHIDGNQMELQRGTQPRESANFQIAIAAGPTTSALGGAGCSRDHQENCDLHMVEVQGIAHLMSITYERPLTCFGDEGWATEPDFNPAGDRIVYTQNEGAVDDDSASFNIVTQSIWEELSDPRDGAIVGSGGRPDYVDDDQIWFGTRAGLNQALADCDPTASRCWDDETVRHVPEADGSKLMDPKVNPAFPWLLMFTERDGESDDLRTYIHNRRTDDVGIAYTTSAGTANEAAGHPFWHPSGRAFVGAVDTRLGKGTPHVYIDDEGVEGNWVNEGGAMFTQKDAAGIVAMTSDAGRSPFEDCVSVYHNRVNWCDGSDYATASVQCFVADGEVGGTDAHSGDVESVYSRVYLIDFATPTNPVYYDLTTPIAEANGHDAYDFEAYTATCAPRD